MELALVLPLLVMFLFGIIEFSMAYSRVQGMNAAAREGARVAALGGSTTEAQVHERAVQAIPPFINAADLVVKVYPEGQPDSADWCKSTSAPRVVVDVSVEDPAKYRMNIPFVGDLAPNYRATGVFRCETNRPS